MFHIVLKLSTLAGNEMMMV